MKRKLKLGLGFLLIVLGLVGLILPIIPGVLLLTAGGVLLAPSYPVIERVLGKLKLCRSESAKETKVGENDG